VNRLVNRMVGRLMGAFVAQGVRIDGVGRLCLPDGLTPERVQRFIELCTGERYDSPRAAMHHLFGLVGVAPKALAVLNQIVHEGGDVDLAAAARHWKGVAAALPALHQIPARFRDFLVQDLGLAKPASASLEAAVVSTRTEVAARVGCKPDWDAILARPEQVSALAAPWRARRRRGR
jgi:hypothetical protein